MLDLYLKNRAVAGFTIYNLGGTVARILRAGCLQGLFLENTRFHL